MIDLKSIPQNAICYCIYHYKKDAFPTGYLAVYNYNKTISYLTEYSIVNCLNSIKTQITVNHGLRKEIFFKIDSYKDFVYVEALLKIEAVTELLKDNWELKLDSFFGVTQIYAKIADPFSLELLKAKLRLDRF